jgi:hypothetical protein
MPSAKNSIPSASSALTVANCLETVHSSWRKAMHTAKLTGMSYSQRNASPAGSPSKLAIDGLKL